MKDDAQEFFIKMRQDRENYRQNLIEKMNYQILESANINTSIKDLEDEINKMNIEQLYLEQAISSLEDIK